MDKKTRRNYSAEFKKEEVASALSRDADVAAAWLYEPRASMNARTGRR